MAIYLIPYNFCVCFETAIRIYPNGANREYLLSFLCSGQGIKESGPRRRQAHVLHCDRQRGKAESNSDRKVIELFGRHSCTSLRSESGCSRWEVQLPSRPIMMYYCSVSSMLFLFPPHPPSSYSLPPLLVFKFASSIRQDSQGLMLWAGDSPSSPRTLNLVLPRSIQGAAAAGGLPRRDRGRRAGGVRSWACASKSTAVGQVLFISK
jgi:hypothetical protein